MTFQSKLRVFFCFLFMVAKAAPWTIDLPEVRRQLFEEHDKLKKYTNNEYNIDTNAGRKFYSNIQGNSKHNSDEEDIYKQDKDMYANAFGHQSYMEKKVSDIVQDGGTYLEGLRKALEDYSRFLEECRKRSPQNSNSTWMPAANATQSLNGSDSQNITIPGMPMSTLRDDSTGLSTLQEEMTCREATEASEKVRRYADLAMWATKRLQDLAYAKEYQRTDQYEENELILKLAWFLDQLAILTGYQPNFTHYLTQSSSTTSTTSPTPPTLVPQTQELTSYLMNCIKANSSMPATVRCRYTLPLPDNIANVIGATSTASPNPDGSDILPLSQIVNDNQPMELLITADDHRNPRRISKRSPDEYYVPIPVHEKPKPVVDFIVKKLSNLKAIVKSVKKNAMADFTSQLAYHKHLHRRAIDDDTTVLLNRISNHLSFKPIAKSDTSNDQQNEQFSKLDDSVNNSDQTIIKSDHIIAKSGESIIKTDDTNLKSNESSLKIDDSNIKSDEPIVNIDKSTTDILSLKQFPVFDASVVNTKSFKKRSISDSGRSYNLLSTYKLSVLPYHKILVKEAVKSVKKRFADDPLSKLTNYYIKHKVWDNSNPAIEKNNKFSTNFEVNNDLQSKIIKKRSLIHKKNKHLKFSPLFHIPNSKKHKHSNKNGKPKLQFYFNSMLEKKHKKWHTNAHKVSKRSLKYEDMYVPRIPANPVGDISYYVKNKKGRDYNPSLTQAARVRLGLQQVFGTGNILVIHRYGSNYNPAVQDAFLAGLMRSIADS